MKEGEKAFEKRLVGNFSFELEFDEQKLQKFAEKANMSLDLVPEQALYELNCGELVDNQFVINNAGLLFFAKQPERRIRQNYITCVRYQGNTMISAIDRKDLYGGLISLVDEAEAFVKKHTRLAFKMDGFRRIDIEEYPYSAVREAIVNAVCHRDYDIENNIFVNVFNDRIEVISPGSIPRGLTLKEVEGKSIPRNAIITELFRKAGYIERLGTGLKRMKEEMLMHGLDFPRYTVTKVYFQVTFNGPGDKILDLVQPSNELDLRTLGLNERQIEILPYLQQHKFTTSEEYAKKFDITNRTARRDLEKLAAIGYLEKTGKTRASKYSLKEKLPPLSENE